MRKLQQVAVVALTAGSVGILGIGSASAAVHPAGDQRGQQAPRQQMAPQRQQSQQTPLQQVILLQRILPSQQAPQQQAAPRQQAPQQQAAPRRQQAPRLISVPHNSKSLSLKKIYNPAQECSPQTVAQVNLPVGLLRPAVTKGYTCKQLNPAFIRK